MQPNQSYGQQPYNQPPADYSFITDPGQNPKKRFNPLGTGSLLKRVLIISAGLILVLIILVVAKNIVAGPPKLTNFVTATEQQQELIHLSVLALKERSLSADNKNFAVTAEATITSDQRQTVKYLVANKTKISNKQLGLMLSPANDTSLSDAATANTYNQVFHDLMTSQLQRYEATLKAGYSTAGPAGKQLLHNLFTNAQLLLQQLNTSTT